MPRALAHFLSDVSAAAYAPLGKSDNPVSLAFTVPLAALEVTQRRLRAHLDAAQVQKQVILEVFGNPYRPAAVDGEWLSWNSGAIVNLAQAIYDERAFERLPILADALEDAGCHTPEILEHCRGPNGHARGCWLLDLLLARA